MMQLYDINQAQKWDEIVKSFAKYDVYYLNGYVKAFMIHGDGNPYLLYYEENGLRAIYVFMMRHTDLPGVFDSTTPYGYGGVLFEGNDTLVNKQSFWKAYKAKMIELNIIDNFVRYHPVLANAVPMKNIATVIDLGKTVAIDLESPEVIWENIHSKNRNMIRKAEKKGIEIRHGKGMSLFKEFIKIYNATMDKNHADVYYYFGDKFYESIYKDLADNFEIFYAMYEEKIIAMSIMIFANGRLNYHLSASEIGYYNLAPSNLLIYKAAIWGYEQGMKTFHLGGGVGSGEDNLFKFKIAFNKKSDFQFSIGKEIFRQDKYEELIELRSASDPNFVKESNYFPIYRTI